MLRLMIVIMGYFWLKDKAIIPQNHKDSRELLKSWVNFYVIAIKYGFIKVGESDDGGTFLIKK